jgi:fructose-bisphosphate aldolase, class I
MSKELLRRNAAQIVSKIILAADESSGTIQKRFDKIGLQANPETNRDYRLMLFQAPRIEDYVSGIILFKETLEQATKEGQPIPQYLVEKGIMPGIKVDKGTEAIPGFNKDTYTKGFDGLMDQLKMSKERGAVFAKWRSTFTIDVGSDSPNYVSINRNAEDLALYASICQSLDIVPIVEPEVLMDGTHSFKKDEQVTRDVLRTVFKKLKEYKVDLGGMILKPNMVTPNKEHLKDESRENIAIATLNAIQDTVPLKVAGIAFLSGGQSPEMATINLNSINRLQKELTPSNLQTRMTASYGRALQGEALETWAGKKGNIPAAQDIFIARAKKVYSASNGEL